VSRNINTINKNTEALLEASTIKNSVTKLQADKCGEYLLLFCSKPFLFLSPF